MIIKVSIQIGRIRDHQTRCQQTQSTRFSCCVGNTLIILIPLYVKSSSSSALSFSLIKLNLSLATYPTCGSITQKKIPYFISFRYDPLLYNIIKTFIIFTKKEIGNLKKNIFVQTFQN